MTGLKPCPFCGGTSVEAREITVGGTGELFFVQCECGARGPVVLRNQGPFTDAEETAGILWNERRADG